MRSFGVSEERLQMQVSAKRFFSITIIFYLAKTMVGTYPRRQGPAVITAPFTGDVFPRRNAIRGSSTLGFIISA